ncbi:MAG: HU family DNA-binding protein [Phycisphaerales bacterium]
MASDSRIASKTKTKKDLVEDVARRTGIKRVVVKGLLQNILDQMAAQLAGGYRLEFRDFGVFEVRRRAARVAQNPKTLKPVEVPARLTVKFKVGRQLRATLENGGARPTNNGKLPADTSARAVEVKPRPGARRGRGRDPGSA